MYEVVTNIVRYEFISARLKGEKSLLGLLFWNKCMSVIDERFVIVEGHAKSVLA